jgi:hypothetical protein
MLQHLLPFVFLYRITWDVVFSHVIVDKPSFWFFTEQIVTVAPPLPLAAWYCHSTSVILYHSFAE